jgi:mannose-6-phosphate isomerase-like protein (cupin superfamily)
MRVELDVHRPLLLAPGEGETVTDRPERTLRILGELDELIVTWFRYEADEEGPEPHVHRRHTDSFYVLDGELELGLGPDLQRVSGGAGTFAAAPPNVVHTFRNASNAGAFFLNVHAPSQGFGNVIRGGGEEGFDQFDPPSDGGGPLEEAVLSRPDDGERLENDFQALVKAGADDGDAQLTLLEARLPPGYAGPPLHLHRQTAEAFFVLEGTLEFVVAGDRALLGAGGFALAPPGVSHTFANPNETEARCLLIAAPGGIERLIREGLHATAAELAALGPRHDTFFD